MADPFENLSKDVPDIEAFILDVRGQNDYVRAAERIHENKFQQMVQSFGYENSIITLTLGFLFQFSKRSNQNIFLAKVFLYSSLLGKSFSLE